ncbi:MAG: NUDIX domain-containing protein [Oscillospiraceae bacterium]|nr:NUDIX domain-containing protein [Oscillospiraceae bacterium]
MYRELFCKNCGTRLTEKFLQNEGNIPYCETCGEFRFPSFNTAVSMIVRHPEKPELLLIQQYGRPHFILTAGYVNQGESAENAVIREISEELGAKAVSVQFNQSQYFEPSNTLMLNFSCMLEHAELHPNQEIDAYQWFDYASALEHIKPESLAKKFLTAWLNKQEDFT